ncbi:Tip elongation protein 1 [Cladophialophora carrionii]|uniref:Tip elongation protein 1 n=1 Tax=Cladophialophora carrionii TaxID=86049 RepID=A0A1C1CR29_9EURO|nr:Tip elongation protein 1 [Cladophialophora carrionii]
MANINIGDTVMVPGDMYGTVKFIGPVAGKKGTFAGVQLATEYAGRGKNSGEVDGKHYFRTTIPGSGIFLPLEKAVKKPGSAGGGGGAGLGLSGVRASPGPGTPTNRLASFNQGGRTPGAGTTGMAKPGFSQSIGPGAMRPSGAASPGLKPPPRRESLPRPSSPLRKVNTPTPRGLATPKARPSGIGLAKSTNGGAVGGPYARPGQRNNFSQSLRQGSSAPAASPSLGPESSFDEIPEHEAEFTPTPTPNFSRKPGAEADSEKYEAKIRELNEELAEARRQLRDQSTNFVEMERNFNEIQKLMPSLEEGKQTRQGEEDEEDLPRDIVSLRDALREKNDKIKLLTAEFDANRADFRSTIDTLEMASTETERVYEKRVDELLEEVRNLQDRSEDVETVAQQLKQLEELVQELEEGLEDARRGEAEARGEVEFLRGEVERSRSELRRERERMKTEEQLNGGGGYSSSSDVQALEAQIMAKDDEIRGLKVIIQNLNAASPKRPNGASSGMGNGHQRNDSTAAEDALQKQICDLEQLLQQKSAHEEELVQEVKQLRNSVTLSKFPMPVGGAAFGLHTAMRSPHSRGNSDDLDRKHLSTGTVGSQRTVVLGAKNNGGTGHERKDSQPMGPESWHDAPSRGASPTQHHHGERERSDDGVTDVSTCESAVLWCEICEEGGHDILTCSNMFGPGKKASTSKNSSPRKAGKEAPSGQFEEEPSSGVDLDRPAPLMSRKFTNNTIASHINSASNPPPEEDLPAPPHQADDPGRPESPPPVDEPMAAAAPPSAPSKLVEGTGAQAGMLAGRTTGVIDPEKWCALCEKDGHDSVDCPVEEAF